ncbi:MAG: ExbD/TolR family protein, partial [Cetobacterium sp.]
LKVDKDKTSQIIEVKKDELLEKLKNIVLTTDNKKVSLVADREINYGDIVDIMSDIKLSGATAIDIETKGK